MLAICLPAISTATRNICDKVYTNVCRKIFNHWHFKNQLVEPSLTEDPKLSHQNSVSGQNHFQSKEQVKQTIYPFFTHCRL